MPPFCSNTTYGFRTCSPKLDVFLSTWRIPDGIVDELRECIGDVDFTQIATVRVHGQEGSNMT